MHRLFKTQVSYAQGLFKTFAKRYPKSGVSGDKISQKWGYKRQKWG